MDAWIGGRTVLVDASNTDRDKAFDLAAEYEGFHDVMGPLINGLMAFTWEDDQSVSDADLIARSIDICEHAQADDS